MKSMRPTSQYSRVSVSDTRGDSIPAGQARVRLKLGAIGYANAQIGISASIDIAGVALDALCDAAVNYWQVITGRAFTGQIDHAAAAKLVVAALAYVNARHGVDANIEMTRAGTSDLCAASIVFCESLMAPSSR